MIATLFTEEDDIFISRIDLIDWLQENDHVFPRGHPTAMAHWLVEALTVFGECTIELDGNYAAMNMEIGGKDLQLAAVVEDDLGTFFKVDDIVMMVQHQAEEMKELFGKDQWKEIDDSTKGFVEVMDQFKETARKEMYGE
jgi:hypothetical protein